MIMNTGKVFLVGAGPGDAGLFTRKGFEVLQKADVVVYDNLVGDGVLALIPDHARTINVGKRASNHTMPQEQMNLLLLEEAKKGQMVVRLKGGDPFLFGRGGEELELLAKEGIPFEVVPGVTSSIAVPAYNGIPVTHRDFTSSLHIITGHKRAGKSYDINFKALVDTKGTLVFLMGVTALPDICGNLIEAGMDPAMPAAILQKGTTAGQKRIVATVSTLEEEVKRQGIETPAIIVIGKVCSLAENFAWYEKLPLEGCKVLVTRPKGRVSTLSDQLREKGAEVLEIPAIATEAIPENLALIRAVSHLADYQWVAFTSPYGVKVFFEQLQTTRIDVRTMAHLKFAVIGEGTRKELENRGFYCDLMPSVYDGAALGKALAEKAEPGSRILLPRAKIGNPEILEPLGQMRVDDIAIYDTNYASCACIDETALFEKGEIDCAVFTSTSTVQAFAAANPSLDYTGVTAACIGRQTADAASALGMQVRIAEKATISSLLELTEQIAREKKEG